MSPKVEAAVAALFLVLMIFALVMAAKHDRDLQRKQHCPQCDCEAFLNPCCKQCRCQTRESQ